jgi:putative phosphoesterase
MIVGVISDTHGLLRPEALEALAGSDVLIHAGDIGSEEILPTLARIAPVTAVKGNIDAAAWANVLPETAEVAIGADRIYVIHDVHTLQINPAQAGYRAAISGHSHKPSEEVRAGVLYLNPGSAGPRRFQLPVTLAQIRIQERSWAVVFRDLLR